MKKIISILACVCLLLTAIVIPASATDSTANEIVLTVNSLGLASNSYSASTATVDEVGFEWVQLGNYGDGIQVRDKNGNTSTLWNTSAFGTAIKEIKLVYSSTKDVQYANADAEIFSFGNEAGTYTYSTKLSTEAGVKEYTITPDAETYTFFKFEHDVGYTFYWESITIVLNDNAGSDDSSETTEVALTVDSLGLASNSYSASTATVDEVGFEWVQLGNYGDGIQVRDKNGNTSTLWNTSAFGAAIKEIKLVYSSTKDVQYANADAEIFSFGNEAGTYSYSTKLSTEAGVKEYTITPDAETYTFFKFEHDLGYTMYWDSITIVLVEEEVDTPCEHTATSTEPNGDETHKVVCDACSETVTPAVDCTDADANGKCDVCDGDVAVENTLPTPDDTNTLTIAEAVELGAAQANSAYTEDRYYVTGQVTSVTGDVYGNMYITDEDGNEIYIYGMYSADGEIRYDAMDSKPDAGDTVTVYTVVGNSNGTPQLKNVWLIEFTEGELNDETPVEPEADSVLTLTEAAALGLTKRSGEYTTNKYYVTGTITGFYGSQGEIYGNIYIADEDGNEFLIYGTWEVLDEIRYDAMETKPVVGDTVTVYGVIGQYNNTAQMKNGVYTTAPVVDDDDDDDTTNNNNSNNSNSGAVAGGTTNNNTTVNTDTSTTSPDTGDNVGAVVAMAIAAGAVILYTSKKR